MIQWAKAMAAVSLIDQSWPDMKQAVADDVFRTHDWPRQRQRKSQRA